MIVENLEISLDDELLNRSPRILRGENIYIPYCVKNKDVCKSFPGEDCINYVELMLKK